LNDLNGMAIIEVAPPHLSIWDRALKRAFDIVVAALSLIIALPFLVVFAVIIKVTSPGPVLFRQTRTGKDRRPFTIYKFRSMQTISTNHPATNGVEPVPDPGAGVRPLHEVRNKSAEQHRITGIGRFLRRTGFDELPQLLNVLGGSMSIVGPRPFTPEESVTDEGTRRFEVRPGITGLWQVSGRNDLDHQDLSRLDTLYVASWSVWWDLKIIWDTPVVMLRGSGAY